MLSNHVPTGVLLKRLYKFGLCKDLLEELFLIRSPILREELGHHLIGDQWLDELLLKDSESTFLSDHNAQAIF